MDVGLEASSPPSLVRDVGSALSAKREDRQFNELRIRVLTHNLMLLGARA